MLHYTFFEEFNFKLLRAIEPFSLSELYALLEKARQNGNPVELKAPGLLDFRQVNVANFQMPDVRRHLMKKAALGSELSNFPVVYIVAGSDARSTMNESVGYIKKILRMKKGNLFVTEELTDASAWLAKRVNKNKYAIYRELNRVMQPLDRFHPNM